MKRQFKDPTIDVPINVSARAVGKKILVKRAEAEDVTDGGIILPEQSKEMPQIGFVVSVGPLAKIAVAVGDLIAFSRFAGVPLVMPDKSELWILDEADVFVVLDEADGIVMEDVGSKAKEASADGRTEQ